MGGPVDDDMANLIVAQLLYLDSAGKQDITMYVNSPGGSVTAGAPPCARRPALLTASTVVTRGPSYKMFRWRCWPARGT